MKFKYNTEIVITPESRLLTRVEELEYGVWYKLVQPISIGFATGTYIRRSNNNLDQEFRLGLLEGDAMQLVGLLMTLPEIKQYTFGQDIYILTEGEIY